MPSLSRSLKLQEHFQEQGGALAPGTSLRLEVTLLATHLRGQRPEIESFLWLCLWSMWIKALLITMKWTENIGPSSLRTKAIFSSLADPSAITYNGMVTFGRDILGFGSSLYNSVFLLWSGLSSGMCTDTCKTDPSPSSPISGNIPGKPLWSTQGGIRRKGEIRQRSWW